MSELLTTVTKLQALRGQLAQICNNAITEDDLQTMRSLIDSYFASSRQKHYFDEVLEEFGAPKDDFDDWRHDPEK